MKRSSISLGVTLLVAALLLPVQPAVAKDLVTAFPSQGDIVFDVLARNEGVLLSVSGPCKFSWEKRYKSGDEPVFRIFDANGEVLPDGSYTWQVRLVPYLSASVRDDLATARKKGDTSLVVKLKLQGILPDKPLVQAGFFTISKGAILDETIPEPRQKAADPQIPRIDAGLSAGAAKAGPELGLKDFVINDDLIVDGSACIGFDCVNGESFGFDTIRLKENNLRLKFDDTSVAASFPRNDWQLTANDSANGGASKFSIDDISGGRTPFTVEANAPSHSLYVDDGGRIGNGTSTPSVEFHTVDGDTPTVRLQQDGSSGFAPQTWDVAGNETNFFVRDVTNGSKLPFRIRPNAPTSSIFIDTDGEVGLGTSSPDTGLNIERNDGQAAIKIEEKSTTALSRNLAEFINNGKVNLRFEDTNSGNFWRYEVDNRFIINHSGDATDEMLLQSSGNMTINGTLTENSDRNAKNSIVAVDAQSILDKLAALPIAHWQYNDTPGVRHIGPMAQDFYATFEVGETPTGITAIDRDGVALAAIQALNQKLEEKDALIQQLAERLAALEKLIQ